MTLYIPEQVMTQRKLASIIGAGTWLIIALATILAAPKMGLAQPAPADPAHAAHVAAGAMPPDTAKGDPALLQQISQLKAKVAQLEASLAANAPAPAAAPMAGMKSATPSPMTAPDGMAGMAAPPAGAMNKMAMMEKMMDKMMSMGDGAMPPPAPMSGGGMGMMDMDDKMKMGGGAMPAGAPAAGMSAGGGMGMDQMEMAGMMGMGAMPSGAAGAMSQSVLPGFPGASHLYHIGATDFFLDHPQHVTFTTEQKAALNKAKEQALLAKSTTDRAADQAEQELWSLTAADQPDAAKIEAKIREIAKLRGDERLAFIRAVGDASKLLTDEQRKILTGFAQPAPAAPMPAGGMKGM
jgi:hypothetical protein